MLSKAGKLSLRWFLTATVVLSLVLLDWGCERCSRLLMLKRNIWIVSLVYGGILAIGLRYKYAGFPFQVSVRSVLLGTIFSFGVIVIFYSNTHWNLFGVYVCIMALFHYSEFLAISWCNPRTLSLSSFLLNHSPQYNMAAVASWIEFGIENTYFPEMKKYYFISAIGFTLCLLGEILRKTAMITGSTNFDHIVQTEKRERHELVTHGVYAYCRHPSYVGWFYWSIGTQGIGKIWAFWCEQVLCVCLKIALKFLLLNPVCAVVYTIASWRFFRDRIYHEEQALLQFFRRDYMEYQKKVGTGLPWIRGGR